MANLLTVPNRQRLKEFDIAKGIGILCVILGHLEIPIINRVVYVFHMPLFFLISGYFLTLNGSIESFVKKKLRGLIFPYIVSCIFVIISYLFWKIIFDYPGRHSLIGWIAASIYGAGCRMDNPEIGYIGALWFLLALFWATIIVRIVANWNGSWLFISIISYLGWKTSADFYLPFSLQSGMFASLFVYLGLKFKELQNCPPFPQSRYCMLMVYGIILFTTLWNMIFFKGFYMVSCFCGNGLMDIIAALSACYILYGLSKKAKNKFVSEMISFYGRNSLIVLCFHMVEHNTIPYYKLSEIFHQNGVSDEIVILVVLLIKLIWCSTWILIINRIPFFNYFFQMTGFKVKKI